ncbi:MAG TPA: pantoate--beta-alanine ligase, partial [Kofleriaceae bacterium]|nr:pantoate--beta-alanine ligase [Kofleriaceae bacterium]
LHEGHLSLVRLARERAGRVVASIFVNPTQFAPHEDFEAYPRDEAGDAALLAGAGCDLLFAPSVAEMYPPGASTTVIVRGVSEPLDGQFRPSHFAGVATIVTKLLNQCGPDVAVFGEKDFQQLALIRRMTADLDFGVEIVGIPIVREPDGLAMSSRNAYLSDAERKAALCLSRALAAARARFSAGERDPVALVNAARSRCEAESLARIDYVELRDATTLQAIEDEMRAPAVLALAVFIGNTRLIDNAVLAP